MRLETEKRSGNELLWRLRDWGVSEVDFLDPDTGELKLDEYCSFLRGFMHQDGLGELLLPESLIDFDSNGIKVGVFSAPMGFGHHRLSRHYQVLLKTLGVEVEHINLGEVPEDRLALAGLLKNLKTAYINGSNKAAVEMGLSQYKDLVAYDRRGLFTQALKLWERYFPEHFYNTLMGKPGKRLTPESTRKTFRWLNKFYGKELKKYLKSLHITHHLVLYPMINALLDQKNTVLVGTDCVLEPAGWIPEPLLVVETEIARDKLVEAWNGKFEKNIYVTDGFPSHFL